MDTTLVSALHCDGSAIRGAPNSDGIALALHVVARNAHTLSLSDPLGGLAGEVVGRWSRDADVPAFVGQISRERRNCTHETQC